MVGVDGERRQATILVADISGYTALCGRFDAEQVQAMLGRFYEVTDRIVANYGGQVIDPPSLDDGVRWLATVKDPAGNTIGIVQLGPR